MTTPLSRRALLRGLSGAALALPFLEIMRAARPGHAAAAGPPRFLVCFGGQSLGADDDPLHNDYVPDKLGAGYDLKSALAPLAPVRDLVSVVSGLVIPEARGGPIPAGGRGDEFHISSLSPLLSGVRSGSRPLMGATADQLVADALGQGTLFRSLAFRVQAAWYLSVSAPYGRDMISCRLEGGKPAPVPPTVSPKAAFQSLFFGPPPTDDKALKERAFQLRARRSVLDLVHRSADQLHARLGRADRQRLERHLDEVRDLERRVQATDPGGPIGGGGGGICKPPQVADDPPIGGNQGEGSYGQGLGYGGEEERARAFCDLIHMAFACDLTRSASLQFTMAQSHLNMFKLTGQATDLHEISHGGVPGRTLAVSKAIAWHMKHFAYLLGKLRDTPDGDGTLLDRCAIAFLHEGGHGLDTATGKQNSAHSTQNMACLLAGRAGGLKAGQHVAAPGRHPASVLLTAMHAVGVRSPQLGEVSGTIPGLLP